MRKILVFASFVLGNFAILVIAILALTIYTTKNSSATDLTEAPLAADVVRGSYDSYGALPFNDDVKASRLVAGDARPKLIEQFFNHYGSPMVGQGQAIVATADKYKLPFNLLPAIAQCEGNLGKSMPYNSYNPFGFGIYGDNVIRFSSWAEAFEVVAKTIRRDYFDLGLTTPDLMMPKYTPPSTGSWAFCVNKFMNDLL